MNARLIAPLVTVICVLSIGARAGQVVENIQVFDGPTPFIRFVHTSVSDVASFEFAQFLILPKTGRPRAQLGPAMRDPIWKRGVISIPKMAKLPSRSSVSTPAA